MSVGGQPKSGGQVTIAGHPLAGGERLPGGQSAVGGQIVMSPCAGEADGTVIAAGQFGVCLYDGASVEECASYCGRPDNSGCSLTVRGREYLMCGPCQGNRVNLFLECRRGCRFSP